MDIDSQLALLSAANQQIILLFHVAGLDIDEISARFGCSYDAMAQRLARARTRLGKIISEEQAIRCKSSLDIELAATEALRSTKRQFDPVEMTNGDRQ